MTVSDIVPPTSARPDRRGRTGPSVDAERHREVARLDHLAHTLDAKFRIPFLRLRVGADGLIGLMPGIGDTLTALPSAYMVMRGWQLGARKRTLARMGANTGVDWVVGSIPLFGDLFDLGFKANKRNAALLHDDLLPFGQMASAPVDQPHA